jgi:hypothetical protein
LCEVAIPVFTKSVEDFFNLWVKKNIYKQETPDRFSAIAVIKE